MSRRRKALHRSILPDPRFHSTLVTELVGVVLKQGKKTIAEQIVYTALDLLDKKVEGKETPLEKFELCLENIKPRVEVKSRRVGGANYQVPMERVSKSSPVALVVQTTRSRWKLLRIAPRLSLSAGSSMQLVTATKPTWQNVLQQNSLPLRTAKATQSARRTIRTRWPKPTRLSLTSVSNSCAQAQNYPREGSRFTARPFLHFAECRIRVVISLRGLTASARQ